VTRRMLINAQNPEELRVAIVDGEKLENFQLELSDTSLSRGNVYRGMVSTIQPSLNAAFINYGAERDGFLPFHDVVPQAWHHAPAAGKGRIENVLERGAPIVVQVSKDSEGQKGAGLTTNISLAGRYLVLTPYDDTRGVSRKVEDEEIRRKLKEQVASLKVPEGYGFIVRTNALEQTKTTLSRDFTAVMRLWKKIQTDGKKGKGPALLQSDQDLVVRVLRDYLDSSITEVLIDDEDAFEKASDYIRTFMPSGKSKMTRYTERAPLFSRFGVESQIESIFDRVVYLPSGGSIVIDRTEALVAIDVNSGKSTRAATQEQTAINTNVEAASEVARQLRLRDIGGLVVVDFIDMRTSRNRATVEKTLRDALKSDKARTAVGQISENGLLEINRQRMQKALHLRTHRVCPTCEGTGRIASVENVGLQLLRKIESRAAGGTLERVSVSLHPELADGIQNARRQEIAALEREFGIRIEILAASSLHRPEQEIEWFTRDGSTAPEREVARKPESPARPRRGRGRKGVQGEARPPALPPREEEEAFPHAELAPAVEADLDEELPEKDISPAADPAGFEAQKGKRRRRGRRRPAASAASPLDRLAPPVEWAFEDSPVSETPAEELQWIDLAIPSSLAAIDIAPHGDEHKSKRRRRGRRKKKGTSASTSTGEINPTHGLVEATLLQETAQTAPAAATDAASHPRKRRPRRRSRKRHAPAGTPPNEAP
jgi:ribonuclease E